MPCVISGAVRTQEHESDGGLMILVYSLSEGLTDVAGKTQRHHRLWWPNFFEAKDCCVFFCFFLRTGAFS